MARHAFHVRDRAREDKGTTLVWAACADDAARQYALSSLLTAPVIVGAEECLRLAVVPFTESGPRVAEDWHTRAVCEVDDRGVWCIQVGAQKGGG